jgi:RHS repeat-associated protein
MGCIKLSILDEQYKKSELKVSYNKKELNFNFCDNSCIDRGFTDHQHLDVFNLINMGGRVYDPVVGQFLSPDPYVQFPDNPLNYNRYAYALFNPLYWTDPTGEQVKSGWLPIIGKTISGDDLYGTVVGPYVVIRAKRDLGMEVFFRSLTDEIFNNFNVSHDFIYFDDSRYADPITFMPRKAPWDLNGDGKLSKKEADYWWLYGNGQPITVNGNLIDLKGFNLKNTKYSSKNDIYCYSTANAFWDLPWKTAATYGGSCFRMVNGKPQMLSQDYHYDMNSDALRNAMTRIGMPTIPPGATPQAYRINIYY